jgi:predicted ArsR family transcriptional regulator
MPKKEGSTKQVGKERRDEILCLFEEEHRTLQEVADHLGVTKQYISYVLAKEGKQVEQDVDVSGIIHSIQQLGGLSLTDMAKIMGIRREQVTRWSNKALRARISYARRLEMFKNALEHARQKH